MVAQNIFFYLFTVFIVTAAVAVVATRNVVRAALYLAMVFAGVVGIYILLAAEFVATTQILVYIGAIMVLVLFGIMLTRARIGVESDLTHKHWWGAALIAVALFAVMAYSLTDSVEDAALDPETMMGQNTVNGSNTATISDEIFSVYLIPFEAVSVLLLASLVGAIVIARKDR